MNALPPARGAARVEREAAAPGAGWGPDRVVERRTLEVIAERHARGRAARWPAKAGAEGARITAGRDGLIGVREPRAVVDRVGHAIAVEVGGRSGEQEARHGLAE